MDKKIANNLMVGLLVIGGFAAFLFILFNVGGGGILNSQYKLYGKFEHVRGLHMGSEIALSGLRIGVVKTITVDKDSSALIAEFSISKNLQDRIRQDSVASIKTSGVLGDKYIEITIGSPASPALEPGSTIPTQEPEDIMQKGGHLVDGISRQFDKGGELEAVIHNLNLISQNLTAMTAEIRNSKGLYRELVSGTSGAKLSSAVGHLDSLMRKIDSGEGSLGALINDPTVYEDIKSMMGGAKRSSVLNYFMRQFIESGKSAPPPPPEKTKK